MLRPAKRFIDDCLTRVSFPSREPACRILEFTPVNFVGVLVDHGFKYTADDGFIPGTKNQPGHDEMPLTLSGLSGCPLGHQQLVGIEPVHLYFCACLKGLMQKHCISPLGRPPAVTNRLQKKRLTV